MATPSEFDEFGDEDRSDPDDTENSTSWEEETCLFSPICSPGQTFSNIADAVDHDLNVNCFDLLSLLFLHSSDGDNSVSASAGIHGSLANDTYGEGVDIYYHAIRCINFCRRKAASLRAEEDAVSRPPSSVGPRLRSLYLQFLSSSETADAYTKTNDHEEYGEDNLKPYLENDAYLYNLDDLLCLAAERRKTAAHEADKECEEHVAADDSITSTCSYRLEEKEVNNGNGNSNDIMRLMRIQVEALEGQLEMAKSCITKLSLGGNAAKEVVDEQKSRVQPESPPDERPNDTEISEKRIRGRSKLCENKPDNSDSYYFEGYSHHSIHETMLRDHVRTGSYERAILDNAREWFMGKTVMDVGCGTGILSMFAAKAGAKKVIAVDNSRKVLSLARRIAEENGYGDVITFWKGKVEDLVKKETAVRKGGSREQGSSFVLDIGHVDVIVSEWMGYGLLFESMLPSVLMARNAFMKRHDDREDGGTMFPNGAKLFLEGATDRSLDFWSNVHGFNMSAMKDSIIMDLTTEVGVEIVPSDQVATNRYELICLDLNTCTETDLDFEVPFRLVGNSTTTAGCPRRIDKLVVSFDIDFSFRCHSPVSFSTGCQSTPTHWKQAVLWLDSIVAPILDEGEVLTGRFKMCRNSVNPRDIDFSVQWEALGKNNETRADGSIKSTLSA